MLPEAKANVLLVGLRGSGKTTIGPMVAHKLNRPLLDLDELTLQVIGAKTVPEAWSRVGQSGFRTAEAEALRRAMAGGGQVIALGGGTPTAPGVAEYLRDVRKNKGAKVVYLRASAQTLRTRLSRTDMTTRPAITLEDPLAEVETVLAARDPLYASLSDTVVDVDALSADEVAGEIVRRVS